MFFFLRIQKNGTYWGGIYQDISRKPITIYVFLFLWCASYMIAHAKPLVTRLWVSFWADWISRKEAIVSLKEFFMKIYGCVYSYIQCLGERDDIYWGYWYYCVCCRNSGNIDPEGSFRVVFVSQFVLGMSWKELFSFRFQTTSKRKVSIYFLIPVDILWMDTRIQWNAIAFTIQTVRQIT